ncbi:alr0857 family protein [Capilliphycus salinus ALCB114379]|uniref:alr0857 family protein n=2 Tax=Sirenicapillariaceae TaxID=2934961 RepID=UPI0039A76828
MLKLTYTETAFHMERLTQSPEQLVSLRVRLAMRVGQSILVEPSSAAFLLPRHLPMLPMLEDALSQHNSDAIAMCVADAESVEVSLTGTWITADLDAEEENGIFITVLDEYTENLLFTLWQEAYIGASVMKEAGD